MAAITMNTNDPGKAVRFLEDVTITNQTANTTAVTKGVRVPDWASSMALYIFFDSSGGTTPLFDFKLGVPDIGAFAQLGIPTDATDVATMGDQAWDGITQVTGAGPYVKVINVGPTVTADDTGSATASDTYAVNASLPPVFTYTYTTDGTTDDEDYRFRLVCVFKP